MSQAEPGGREALRGLVAWGPCLGARGARSQREPGRAGAAHQGSVREDGREQCHPGRAHRGALSPGDPWGTLLGKRWREGAAVWVSGSWQSDAELEISGTWWLLGPTVHLLCVGVRE